MKRLLLAAGMHLFGDHRSRSCARSGGAAMTNQVAEVPTVAVVQAARADLSTIWS